MYLSAREIAADLVASDMLSRRSVAGLFILHSDAVQSRSPRPPCQVLQPVPNATVVGSLFSADPAIAAPAQVAGAVYCLGILYLMRGRSPWRILLPYFPVASTLRRWFFLCATTPEALAQPRVSLASKLPCDDELIASRGLSRPS